MKGNASFSRHERLRGKDNFRTIFRKGRNFNSRSLRFIYCSESGVNSTLLCSCVAVIVPKKLIRKAHQRNLLKRRLREVYRKHKTLLRDLQIFLIIMVIDKNQVTYKDFESQVITGLNFISSEISANNQTNA